MTRLVPLFLLLSIAACDGGPDLHDLQEVTEQTRSAAPRAPRAPPTRPPAPPARSTPRGAPLSADGLPAVQARSDEPPTRYTLEIDGTAQTIRPDEPLTIGEGAEAKTVVLRVDPYRELDAKGVRFLFPQTYSYEFEESPDFRTWTLTGNAQVITVFHLETLDHEAMGRSMVSEMGKIYGRGNMTATPTSRTLNGVRLEGTLLHVTMAGSHLTQEVYDFGGPGGDYLLILQDTLDDAGKPTAEARIGLQALDATFRME